MLLFLNLSTFFQDLSESSLEIFVFTEVIKYKYISSFSPQMILFDLLLKYSFSESSSNFLNLI
jgi:hypothetical protein